MKIVLVGASGTIGKAVEKELGARHEIVRAGRRGDLQVDITDAASIKAAFDKLQKFDAVVSTSGDLKFGHITDMTVEEYQYGLNNKLMGQVNLVLIGLKYINDRGSFTLTSGVLSNDPIVGGTSASMVSCAIDGFVRGAAIELPRGLRINSVSPGVLVESMGQYGPYFRGHEPVPASRVALAYSKSVEGARTGQTFEVI